MRLRARLSSPVLEDIEELTLATLLDDDIPSLHCLRLQHVADLRLLRSVETLEGMDLPDELLVLHASRDARLLHKPVERSARDPPFNSIQN